MSKRDVKPGRLESALQVVQGGLAGRDPHLARLAAGVQAVMSDDPADLEAFLTHESAVQSRRRALYLVRGNAPGLDQSTGASAEPSGALPGAPLPQG